MVERGHLGHVRQMFMLLADELDDWLVDPAAFAATLAEREQDYLSLYELEPPYIVDMVVPPLSEWRRKDSLTAEQVAVGDVLSGVAGSPGTVTGTARVLLDLDRRRSARSRRHPDRRVDRPVVDAAVPRRRWRDHRHRCRRRPMP